jgi:hypothetical protein
VLEIREEKKIGPVSVQELERRVQNTVEWLCQTFWQFASPQRQESYPQYELSASGYEIKCMSRSLDFSNYVPDEQALEVCGDLIRLSFPDLEGREPTAREAGKLLEQLSQCRCMFGASASQGDFESYMRYRAERYAQGHWERMTPTDFVAAWARYQYDDTKEVQLYLFEMLTHSYKVLARIARKRGVEVTELCSFRYDPVDAKYELDEDFFGAGAHILSAMLSYLMPPGRN